ncbi:hypothetical protein ACZ90_00225 [Streptomyces albus subsp. albus]|nr:hypothetical protein ACZ90_00225 [Streptomyces albus subsp. albus]
MMSAWARMVETATPDGLVELEQAMQEIQAEQRRRTLREVADMVQADLLPDPIGEAEEHVTDVMRALAARLRRMAEGK